MQSLTPSTELLKLERRSKLTFEMSSYATRGPIDKAAAKELDDLLVSHGVSVWFSEKDVGLGVSLMRAIDKGFGYSRVGLVFVIPALLARLS